MIVRMVVHVRVLLETRVMVTNGHGALPGELSKV
jgi:hypothetical protein